MASLAGSGEFRADRPVVHEAKVAAEVEAIAGTLRRLARSPARKLAVIMHRMWLDGSELRRTDEAPA